MAPLGGSVRASTLEAAKRIDASDVLDALSEYRAAETAMLRRTRPIMDRGANDVLALRYVREATLRGPGMRPTELAALLGLSSASITALIDRLVAGGVVVREPHPSDRRASILRSTGLSEAAEVQALDDARRPIADLIESLDHDELETVLGFLVRMRRAMDEVARD
ncbi:transcriptional regulator, MarR family [Pseudarthrobacter chlorophenolicus A6]|uniref:Transcriptional regulator, MarR family n=1 Tax=Pseudarthrobacter chlorophenolicus (strain ATCC 700700 / DSM 12829 / CIP 107037 / JCM 12360 / KCTC 9906 / NCIMB 13794 / A6) TaxID=452863 RepID=B8H942_PSECP|nr:MarR family transcriptional regulator [Pseudarthrobacter chlorophenolicus]ACL38201.1 transcriptional regulator, MarR family [Pseudarthrobacter chlorophenolicus A6]SDQ53490.1 DNA-binding transcriptional regulator, MarR family [Pseudarthrobacter chlorophenolicus]